MKTLPRLFVAAMAALCLLLPVVAGAQGESTMSAEDILKQLDKKPAAQPATRSFRGVRINTAVETQPGQASQANPAGQQAEPARNAAQAPAPAAAPAEKPQVTLYLYFKSGSAELANEASRKQLAAVGRALSSSALAGAQFEIGGHTDAQGSDTANQALSERRAAFVRSQLVSGYGLKPQDIVSRGYGESQPVADNDTEAGRAKNRRVVIKRLD